MALKKRSILEARARPSRPKPIMVRKSRQGQIVEITNERDREFLELADDFVVKAGRIQMERAPHNILGRNT